MTRDAQRYRKTYSFQRPMPRPEAASVVVADALPVKALIRVRRNFGDGPAYFVDRKYPENLDINLTRAGNGHAVLEYPSLVDLFAGDALATVRGTNAREISVLFGDAIEVFTKSDTGSAVDADFTVVFY